MEKSKEDTESIKKSYIFKASFYWTFMVLTKTVVIVKGAAIDSMFLELSISMTFSFRMAASLSHYL